MPNCNACGKSFETFKDLALHIMSAKTGHQRVKKWAAIILTDVNRLNAKSDRPERLPLSEQDKQNKADSQRQLSGENKYVVTICPKCNDKTQRALPIEHTESPFSWKDDKGRFQVLCEYCGRK